MALFAVAPLIAPIIGVFTRAIFAKAILFAVTYWGIALGMALAYQIMVTCCDVTLTGITAIFNNLPPAVWWFFDIFNFAFGFKLILCAVATKYLISWLPFSPK